MARAATGERSPLATPRLALSRMDAADHARCGDTAPPGKASCPRMHVYPKRERPRQRASAARARVCVCVPRVARRRGTRHAQCKA